MKRVLLLAVLLCAIGCASERPFVIKNDCRGSWLYIADGRGNVITERLEYGGLQTVSLETYRGETVYLLASGYELGTNRNLGTAETTRYIPDTSNTPTFQQQIEPWVVSHLFQQGAQGGCHR